MLNYPPTEAAPNLLQTYGSLPARHDLSAAFIAGLDWIFPQKVARPATAGLAHPDPPSHEGPLSNFNAARTRIEQFKRLNIGDSVIDVAREAERLRIDLCTIFARR